MGDDDRARKLLPGGAVLVGSVTRNDRARSAARRGAGLSSVTAGGILGLSSPPARWATSQMSRQRGGAAIRVCCLRQRVGCRLVAPRGTSGQSVGGDGGAALRSAWHGLADGGRG